MSMPMSSSMPMGSTGSNMTMDDMMIPYLHFTGGDNLYFKSLRPTSHGAIAGACIVLALLAIFDRWVAAMRGVAQVRWAQRVRAMTSRTPMSSQTNIGRDWVPTKEGEEQVIGIIPASTEQTSLVNGARVSRSSPPFIASHDIPRGIAFACQALLGYTLMLAVMTFQAAYIISILAGLGIGEVAFGRMGSAPGHVVH
ncbi:copper transporter family protein [Phanerochaete sordida]|uniref:Copper transport protein n=1 Tax=Phanerochaete sordida TaxID=48140 RepID=A0A9P3G1F3_9APHY|nr:copper transporter family protein [Phanerochaete sordida]